MELRSHHLFEELFEIADDATNDFMRNKKTGEYDFQAGRGSAAVTGSYRHTQVGSVEDEP